MNLRLIRSTLPGIVIASVAMLSGISSHADESRSSNKDDVQRLSALIDRHIAKTWVDEGATPAGPASDAEFMRRVYLDVSGRIPPVSELRQFLDSDDPHKRSKFVDRLLHGPAHTVHFTSVLSAIMMPEAESDLQARFLAQGFNAWLREKLAADTPYDELVHDLLSTPVASSTAFNPYQGQLSPAGFYRAKQLKPEELAAGVARTFLGVRIECAQCHDHPFDSWKREDFWSFASFFAGFEKTGNPQLGPFGPVLEIQDRREMAIPESDVFVQAAYLDRTEPKWQPHVGPRSTLADWVTSRDNPWFARATVNRMWAQFFGTGIVDPVDDFGPANAASHPGLLNQLAAEFAKGGFDLKMLIRAITASRAYGLSSDRTHPSQDNARLFARAALRGLTSEQLFGSLQQAVGVYEPFSPRNQLDFTNRSQRSQFDEVFSDSTSKAGAQLSVLQALAMMNGSLTADATNIEKSRTLAAIAEFPHATTPERIEALFLAALSRRPRTNELKRLVAYVDSGGPHDKTARALADVFWALLNSSEFIFNH